MLEKRRLARRGTSRVLVLIVGFMLVLGACGGAASPAPSSAPAQSEAAVASPTAAPAITAPPIDTTAPGPNGGVVVRWFVGLGAGGQPQQLQAEAEFVNTFNNSQRTSTALEITTTTSRRTSSRRRSPRAAPPISSVRSASRA